MQAVLMKLLPSMMSMLLEMLPESVVKTGIDAFFDAIETKVVESDNGVDDMIVLPILRRLRAALDVPDNDDVG